MQLFRLNMNLGKGRKITNPSLMLSFPRPGIAEISFSIWHKRNLEPPQLDQSKGLLRVMSAGPTFGLG